MNKIEKLPNACIIFDVEATCEDKKILPKFDNEIISIGACKIKDNEIIETFYLLVKPIATEITPYCTDLTGITTKDLLNATPYPKAIASFLKFVDSLPIISWGGYDKKQMIKDGERYGLTVDLPIHLNLKEIHGRYNYNLYYNANGSLTDLGKQQSNSKLKNIKRNRIGVGLQKALTIEGLTFKGQHHNALDDAFNTARIYQELYYKTTQKMNVEEVIDYISFKKTKAYLLLQNMMQFSLENEELLTLLFTWYNRKGIDCMNYLNRFKYHINKTFTDFVDFQNEVWVMNKENPDNYHLFVTITNYISSLIAYTKKHGNLTVVTSN